MSISEIQRATGALDACRYEAALDALLDAWRAIRHPRLAAAIEAFDAKLRPALAPLDESLVGEAYHEAWTLRAAAGSVLDVPVLVPGLFRRPLGDRIIARVRELAGRADDPRVARAFAEMARNPPATARSTWAIWWIVFRRLGQLGDASVAPLLRDRLADAPGESKFWPMLYQEIDALLAALPTAAAALDSATSDALAAFDAALHAHAQLNATALLPAQPSSTDSPQKMSPSVGDPLLALSAAICADPSSDALRSVYADALLERGDPRGELIQLQLAPPSPRSDERIRELLTQHAHQWLGRARAVLAEDETRFERGYLARCEVGFARDEERAGILADPIWSTVHTLFSDELDTLSSPSFRALRRIGGFDSALLCELARRRARPLLVEAAAPVRVPVRPCPHLDTLVTDALDDAPGLPALHTLGLIAVGHGDSFIGKREAQALFAELPRVAFVRRLRHLTVSAEPYDADTLADWSLFDALPALQTLVLQMARRVTLARTAGDTVGVRVGLHTISGDPTDQAVEIAGELRRLVKRRIDWLALDYLGEKYPHQPTLVQQRYEQILSLLKKRRDLKALRGIPVTLPCDDPHPHESAYYASSCWEQDRIKRQRRRARERARAAKKRGPPSTR